jgi:hypothetical protein
VRAPWKKSRLLVGDFVAAEVVEDLVYIDLLVEGFHRCSRRVVETLEVEGNPITDHHQEGT